MVAPSPQTKTATIAQMRDSGYVWLGLPLLSFEAPTRAPHLLQYDKFGGTADPQAEQYISYASVVRQYDTEFC